MTSRSELDRPARTPGTCTSRVMTPEEVEQARADAAYRQWWLWFLTLGLLASKPERELTPDLDSYIRPDGTRVHVGHRLAEREPELGA